MEVILKAPFINMTVPTQTALPDGARMGNENLVKLTDAAGLKALSLIQRDGQGEFLRIRITGGGCNGLSYKMQFVETGGKGDILVETGGARVLVDFKTALYLKGTQLDYSDALVGGGFKFENPNAQASCSCGESFNL
jgi:iron-sulfur cluster assembly protein|tara:strand:- start:2634 stop:3044 length:411 start_codon:yes stop_codon:yes gene_type:complete